MKKGGRLGMVEQEGFQSGLQEFHTFVTCSPRNRSLFICDLVDIAELAIP